MHAGTGPSNRRDGADAGFVGETDSRQRPIPDISTVENRPRRENVVPRNVIPENAMPGNEKEEGSTKANMTELVATEVLKALKEVLPPIVAEIKDDIGKTMDQNLSAMWEMFLDSKAKKRATECATAGTADWGTATKKFKSGENPMVTGKRKSVKCPYCGRGHTGEWQRITCYRCGLRGHMGKDCQTAESVCFGCYQPGHRVADCPNTGNATKPTEQPVLRITEGEKGRKMEAPKARVRAFQMTVEETEAELDVIAGTYIVKSLPALVLFDTGE